MDETMRSAADWAQAEFGLADLGDRRRSRRLVNIAENLAERPGGTLPQAFGDWAELKAAYRFFNQAGVGFEAIMTPHWERTLANCREPGEYLLIEDTTLLDYTAHSAARGLGRIGNGGGRGFELHSTLAVRVMGWSLEQRPEGMLVGLLSQECAKPRPAPAGETRRARLERPRRSQRWAAALKAAGAPPESSQWIYVADREADFYEPLQLCRQHGVEFIVRSGHDRRLADGTGHLRAAVAEAEVLGRTTVELRARPGQAARVAEVELRATVVDLDGPWRPGGSPGPLSGVSVLEVREVAAPAEIPEPLHWLLLSSLPCSNRAQAQRVVGRYTARWWIEEYHKALKSGTGVEQSQLECAERLEGLIAILALVAVRLLSTKLLARSQPDGGQAAAGLGPELLALLERKQGVQPGGWTNRNLLRAVARLGGFIGRKSDGEPGWQNIWRGWHRLLWMAQGAKLLQP
jgi:hypothetical protein